MKKSLLAFASVITSGTLITSLYLASLPDPTDIQIRLSTTANAISIAGTTTIFGLLNDDQNQKSDR